MSQTFGITVDAEVSCDLYPWSSLGRSFLSDPGEGDKCGASHRRQKVFLLCSQQISLKKLNLSLQFIYLIEESLGFFSSFCRDFHSPQNWF